MNSKLIVAVIAFFIGLLFCLNYKSSDLIEGFGLSSFNNCPNLLVKKGKKLHLINSKKAMIPGVNPIEFNNLEEYAEYVKWSQKVGIKCPILYYEQSYNTQGDLGYRMLNDPLNPKAGLRSDPYMRKASTQLLRDSNRDDPPFNQNNYSGFDGEDQYIGVKTPLDNVTLQKNEGSLSPMDSDWCGGNCVKDAIKNGEFEGRTRKVL